MSHLHSSTINHWKNSLLSSYPMSSFEPGSELGYLEQILNAAAGCNGLKPFCSHVLNYVEQLPQFVYGEEPKAEELDAVEPVVPVAVFEPTESFKSFAERTGRSKALPTSTDSTDSPVVK